MSVNRLSTSSQLFKAQSKQNLVFHYKKFPAELVDDGHTLKYDFKGDAGSLDFEGRMYRKVKAN